MSQKFELVSKFKPMGDQIKAIEELVKGVENGKKNRSYWVRLEREKLLPFPM